MNVHESILRRIREESGQGKASQVEEAIKLLKEAVKDAPLQEQMDMGTAIMDLEDIQHRLSSPE